MLLNRQREEHIDLKPLASFLSDAQNALGIAAAELNVCLVSDRAMRALNRRFRRKDQSTDVLSFPAKDLPRPLPVKGGVRTRPSAARSGFLGDVAISPATARRNANRLGRSLQSELRVLILHGVLHLLGYDHESDRGEMNRLEGRLRRRLGLPQR
jgi:probable rRNA maturation factor